MSDDSAPAQGAAQPTLTLEDMLTNYIKLRDRKDALRKIQGKELAKYTTAMEAIEAWVKQYLQTQNLQSVSSGDYTAFFKTDRSATVSDMGRFREHVISTGDFDLADFRAKVQAVEDFIKENNGNLPPGVNFSTEQSVQFRRK